VKAEYPLIFCESKGWALISAIVIGSAFGLRYFYNNFKASKDDLLITNIEKIEEP